jgi:hypothetical protein
MKFVSLVTAVISLLFVALVSPAFACEEGQSEGAFGWCYPNVGGTVGQTFQAAKKGDLNTVAKGLGDVTIVAVCPMCAAAGKALLDKNDQALVSTIIGRGLLLTGVGVPPTLVLFDAAGNVAHAIQAKHQPPPIITPPPPGRGKLTYKAITIAACAVKADDGQIAVGWTSAPVLVNVANGTQSTFPNVDLQEKDIVHASANPCPDASVAKGGTSLVDVSLVYSYSQTIPGPEAQIKYLFIGTQAK